MFLYAPLDSGCEGLAAGWNCTFASTKNSEVLNGKCFEVLQYVLLQEDMKMDENTLKERKKKKKGRNIETKEEK